MKRGTILSFLALEGILYLTFMGMDLFTAHLSTTGLKYTGILLCLLFSILCALHEGDRLVPFALTFTALADLFLLVLNEYYLAGLLSFLVTQTIYLIRLYRKSGRIWLPVRIVSALVAVLLVFLLNMADLLNLITVLYFSLLLINMALSWTIAGRKWRTFSLGLSLFVLCDICVGAFNLGSVVPAGFYQFSRIGMWLFYLPSQVLIALSGLNADEISP